MNTDVAEQSRQPQAENKTVNQRLDIRSAKPSDQGKIAELMYSSGADLYDYIYKSQNSHPLDYIRWEFGTGRGLCTHKLLTVAVVDNTVVGTGTFYDGAAYQKMSTGASLNLMRYYGLKTIPRAVRAMDSTRLMQAPKRDELYLANFGVSPELRGTGIGSKIIKHKIAEAKDQGYRLMSLDVSTQNPKAEALYQRLGFVVTKTKSMKGRDGKQYACKKMELFL
ncbi:MAG: GNAT family N-acetyltransferase [Pseudomonadales bacterium]|nr:GNAT family N-acetyltransferase [Pseudomonadales bacterium]